MIRKKFNDQYLIHKQLRRKEIQRTIQINKENNVIESKTNIIDAIKKTSLNEQTSSEELKIQQ